MPGDMNESEVDTSNFSPNSGSAATIAAGSSPSLAMRRLPFSDSPNARSKSITTTDIDTHGVLNRHATKNTSYQVGVSEDKGTRRTMEDAHSFVVDFDNIRGQGFFAVFDGHAGKHAAEWCGNHFHETLLGCLRNPTKPNSTIPDLLNQSFQEVDAVISRMAEESEGKIHSGCTVVTAFIRIEDDNKQQAFLEVESPSNSPGSDSPQSCRSRNLTMDGEELPPNSTATATALLDNGNNGVESADAGSGDDSSKNTKNGKKEKKSTRIKNAFKSLSSGTLSSPKTPKSGSPESLSRRASGEMLAVRAPPPDARRVLYCANAGDARGVLCRTGKAVRLTYDHKGSDKQEAKRIVDAGGFVMSGRVNGVLAVTRSLGDSSMKEFVVGAPYTTETELCEDDEFLILACDGLWDVINDQGAVDLIRDIEDAQAASQKLLKYALSHHTTDNVTVVVVRFKNQRS
ncbi:mgpp2cl-1, protein phosphatase 2C-like protein 1 [Marasmius tenuissimus]|uniref:Mgpp2cl-1, protein phosphatase 2C-like protein 1 n=1 Tax=Marasmius tenuissimus TaxID=585030 RepID=A0ABR3AFK0_9AGAR